MEDLKFYKVWLAKSKIAQLLPRTVFLFGFDRNKNIRESFNNGDYSEVDLTLLCCKDVDRDYPYWEEYLNDLKSDLGYIIPYEDEKGNVYELLVDALYRKNRLRSGALPIAMATREKVYYASDDPMLVLPDCFA